jgi:hypothetical protein
MNRGGRWLHSGPKNQDHPENTWQGSDSLLISCLPTPKGEATRKLEQESGAGTIQSLARSRIILINRLNASTGRHKPQTKAQIKLIYYRSFNEIQQVIVESTVIGDW